jgi:tetratricopeptide (TPR) repeat protein
MRLNETLGMLLAVFVPVLAAQHDSHGGAATEKPVALIPHLGVHTHRISTRSAEAQKVFDQGLTLLFGFNRYEALRSFRKAAELDPAAPMPLWGVAMALGPHINMDMDRDMNLSEGCSALSKARALAAISNYEKAYLEAAATRCPAYQPDSYIEAMRRLHNQYPDDLDAAALYVESIMIPVRWNWWNTEGQPAPGMEEGVRVLEAIMRRNPDHPGANHFYIHAVEMSPSPERAIPSAQRLMGIMPAAGHMVHMPGHIWLVLGDWETAAGVNERAAEADRDYFTKTGVQSGYIGYYLHNLHFVAYARSMQGRGADAIAAADRMGREMAPAIEAMPEMVDAFVPYPVFVRLRFRRWDEVLALPQPDSKLAASLALWHWARALAWAGNNEHANATKEAEDFREARARVPKEWAWSNNKAADIMSLADAVLEARLATDQGTAVKGWQRAVKIQDALTYDEPPAWYAPLRESLGAALLRAGDAQQAESVFREGIRRSPRNGRMLFGLLKSLEAQGKGDGAELVKREFTKEWKKADVELRIEDL